MGTRNILHPKEVVKQDHPHAYGDKPIVIKVFSPE